MQLSVGWLHSSVSITLEWRRTTLKCEYHMQLSRVMTTLKCEHHMQLSHTCADYTQVWALQLQLSGGGLHQVWCITLEWSGLHSSVMHHTWCGGGLHSSVSITCSWCMTTSSVIVEWCMWLHTSVSPPTLNACWVDGGLHQVWASCSWVVLHSSVMHHMQLMWRRTTSSVSITLEWRRTTLKCENHTWCSWVNWGLLKCEHHSCSDDLWGGLHQVWCITQLSVVLLHSSVSILTVECSPPTSSVSITCSWWRTTSSVSITCSWVAGLHLYMQLSDAHSVSILCSWV